MEKTSFGNVIGSSSGAVFPIMSIIATNGTIIATLVLDVLHREACWFAPLGYNGPDGYVAYVCGWASDRGASGITFLPSIQAPVVIEDETAHRRALDRLTGAMDAIASTAFCGLPSMEDGSDGCFETPGDVENGN